MINKCLFPAAGYGTRFLPATKAVPKEMLPILTKPLLQYGVEEAIEAGITNMAFVTGRGKRAIEDHFDHSFELESQLAGTPKEIYIKGINEIIQNASFTYVRQQKMLGLGHAILTGNGLIGEEPFAVILADDLCINDNKSLLGEMIKIYQKHKCSIIAIEEVPLENTHMYGIVDAQLIDSKEGIYNVSGLIEKPDMETPHSNLAIIGRYILTPDIFTILKNINPDKSGEIQLTEALNEQAKQGRVIALKFKGNRFDCGSIKGYLKATNHFAKELGI
jgi:UTP--glucose-1-phosphate uridylyltransferase